MAIIFADLNPIEHLWDHLQRRLGYQDHRPQNADDLEHSLRLNIPYEGTGMLFQDILQRLEANKFFSGLRIESATSRRVVNSPTDCATAHSTYRLLQSSSSGAVPGAGIDGHGFPYLSLTRGPHELASCMLLQVIFPYRRCTILYSLTLDETITSKITEDVASLKEIQIRIEKTKQKFWEDKELLRRNVGEQRAATKEHCSQYKEKNPGVLRILSFQLWLRSMDLFQDGLKEDTDVRNVVLQYRKLLKVACTEKTANKEIIRMADVGERLLQQRMKLGYVGHIMRDSSGPLLHLSLEGKSNFLK
ncbi:hypothetical protein ElyMa_004238300 [Elysia marginata]|uniref:Uncharacterized protein n=1 Tax=Elysia marginata TaxID=1093978 RepID=A0AAV4GSD9_9GAST|nr:hypothetical protein ElyMa_004238300 [Elysia marginata]